MPGRRFEHEISSLFSGAVLENVSSLAGSRYIEVNFSKLLEASFEDGNLAANMNPFLSDRLSMTIKIDWGQVAQERWMPTAE